MAIYAHSTTAPTPQRGLLRAFADAQPVPTPVLTPETVAMLDAIPPVDDPRSTDDLIEEIQRTIKGQLACHGDTQPLLPRHGNHPDDIGVVESRPDHFRLVDEARALHFRRELHQALDFGFALLDALDLPPLALDVIDDAIATLDALDRDSELEEDGSSEPSLGAPENHPGRWYIDMDGAYRAGSRHHRLGDQTHWLSGGSADAEGEHDGREHEAGYDQPEGDDERCASSEVDGEYSCGWTAKISQIHLGVAQDEHETTALERFGKGFIRSGPDDAEDGHDAERDDHHGSEDDPHPWRYDPASVAIAARVSHV